MGEESGEGLKGVGSFWSVEDVREFWSGNDRDCRDDWLGWRQTSHEEIGWGDVELHFESGCGIRWSSVGRFGDAMV